MSQEKNLYPITRKEKILDGQDLAPVTRLEYFLKAAEAVAFKSSDR